MTITRREEAGMAEVSASQFEEFATRIDERFDRAEQRADERFDRLGEQISRVDEKADERFVGMGEQIASVDRESGQNFIRVGQRFDEVDRRTVHLEHESQRINDRLDDLIKVLIGGIIGFTGAVMACFAAVIVLIATQL